MQLSNDERAAEKGREAQLVDRDSEMLLWDSGGALHRLMASLALFVQVDCWRPAPMACQS